MHATSLRSCGKHHLMLFALLCHWRLYYEYFYTLKLGGLFKLFPICQGFDVPWFVSPYLVFGHFACFSILNNAARNIFPQQPLLFVLGWNYWVRGHLNFNSDYRIKWGTIGNCYAKQAWWFSGGGVDPLESQQAGGCLLLYAMYIDMI